MISRVKTISGLVAAGLFVAGVLVALTYPVSSKDKTGDPNTGIALVRIGI